MAFVPTDVSGCILWMKADSLGLSDGDPVSSWVDEVVPTNHFDQTGALRPTYHTNALNGLPVVRSDGTQYLETSALTALPTGGAARTLFIVARPSVIENTKDLFGYGAMAPGSLFDVYTFADGHFILHYNTGQVDSPANTWLPGQTVIMEIKYQFTTLTVSGNGVSNSGIVSLGTASFPAYIFNGGQLAGPPKADIGEIVFYNTALSPTDETSVYNYLYKRWFPQPKFFGVKG